MHYNGTNSYLFVNGTEIIKFKGKDSEITPYPLCLGNISKDWSLDNMKKTSLKGRVYDFNVDYDIISVSDILDIHKYLMEKNKIITVHVLKKLVALRHIKMFKFIKQIFVSTMMFFSCLSSMNPLECVSMKNQSRL